MKKFDNTYTSNTMRGHVYKEIEHAILNGEIAPGTSLAEVKLSGELGVSRTPIREALMQLEMEGLVKTVPNKGAVVVGVTTRDIYDIYTLRMTMEGLAARRAVESITDEELHELQEIVELQEFYMMKNDVVQVWHLDSRFHELLYDCCRSLPIRQVLTLFHNYLQKAREMNITGTRAPDTVREHRAIFDAIERRDADAAEHAMQVHVRTARDWYFEEEAHKEGRRPF